MVYNEEVINQIKERLTEQEETKAVAESVTAGNLQAALSIAMEAKNSSRVVLPPITLDKKRGT